MRKQEVKRASPRTRAAVSAVDDDLVFEVDARELKRLLAARALRRKTVAQRQRDMLASMVSKGAQLGLNELTRERLERSIRINEDYAAFLVFARVHLVRPRGASRLTPSDLRVLDLLPSQTFD